LLVGTEISQRRKFQQSFRNATLWGIGSTALLGAMLGLWLSRRLMARVRAVSVECGRIVAGDLSRRLPVGSARDEFDALAIAVNQVLARLDEQTGVLRATFDSAAHDLRGPLSRLRGRLEELQRAAAIDEFVNVNIERALQDIDILQRTLTTLLQIAQAESRAPLSDSVRVNLGDLAQEIAALYEPAARDQGLALRCNASAAHVNGSRQLLAQLISNLIENALKHAAAGGVIGLSVREANAGVLLEVMDRGPGIPPQDRERALRPFVRLNSAATLGSGLGLSLVAAIARLHEAQLALQDNEPGLRIVVKFKSASVTPALSPE
jgi:signal transduction histidine kinase